MLNLKTPYIDTKTDKLKRQKCTCHSKIRIQMERYNEPR